MASLPLRRGPFRSRPLRWLAGLHRCCVVCESDLLQSEHGDVDDGRGLIFFVLQRYEHATFIQVVRGHLFVRGGGGAGRAGGSLGALVGRDCTAHHLVDFALRRHGDELLLVVQIGQLGGGEGAGGEARRRGRGWAGERGAGHPELHARQRLHADFLPLLYGLHVRALIHDSNAKHVRHGGGRGGGGGVKAS